MSFPTNKFVKISSVCLAVLLVLIFISLILVSEVIVPREIQNYVKGISEDTGFKVEVKDIGFDLLSGLKGEGIEIYELPDLLNPTITVGKIAARPDIFSSLLNWKVKIRVAIDKPVFSFNRKELDSFVRLIKEKEEEKAEKKPLPIEVEYLEVNNGKIQTPLIGDPIFLERIEIDPGDTDKGEEQTVRLSGLLSFRNNGVRIEGKIKPFLDTPVGELEVNAPELNMEFLPDTDEFPEKLVISSSLNFRISDSIISQGWISFKPAKADGEKGSYLSGKAEYSLAYDRISDTAFINSANLNMDKLLHASLAGHITSLRTERVFDLKGEVDNIRLENFSEWLSGVSPVRFSGDVEPIGIGISGSGKDNDVSLSGEIPLSGVYIEDDQNRFQVNGLGGKLEFKKAIQRSEGLSAQGGFSSSNIQTKIGEFNNVSGNIQVSDDNGSNSKTIGISSLKASFLDGSISGDTRLIILNGEKTLEGELQGRGLGFKNIPKDISPVSFDGSIETINAEFTGKDLKALDADLSFYLRDFRAKSGGKEVVALSGAKTTDSFRVEIPYESEDEIIVKSEGLYLENLLFNGFVVKRGDLSKLLFKLGNNDNWILDLSGTGSRLQVTGGKVSLGRFRTEIHTEKNEQTYIRGNLSGQYGRFQETSFPALSTDFSYKGDLLELRDLRAQTEDYGEVETEELNIVLPEEGDDTPYEITLAQGSFAGFDQRIKSEGIGGSFVVYNEKGKEPRLAGNVFINETDILKSRLKNLSLKVNFSQEKIGLEDISGKFLGGDLTGNLLITDMKSSHLVSLNLEAQGISAPFDNFPLSLGNLNFGFTGTVGKDFLPRGDGKIGFTNLMVGEDGAASPLRGQVDIQTVHETVSMKNGFIENGEGEKINFFARIEDTLNQNRSFHVDLPEATLVSVQEVLSPVLPEFLKQGEIGGWVGLDLVVRRFLQEGESWNGRLFIKDAALRTQVSGTPFSVENVNGTIPIQDESRATNSLVHFIKKWKLERASFGAFLDTIKEGGIKNKRDFLEIGEIEYGFLKLEDIECVIKLDKEKINLQRFESSLYDGSVFSRGVFDFGGDGNEFNFSFLFRDISLEDASDSISIEDYITGRVNGLFWLTGSQGRLSTLDGSFNFWVKESEEEPMRIGRALLEKLGVKEKFFLGSSRRYDKGEIYGYIGNGVITFKELHISNTILGIRDLLIQVDSKRNSISVANLLSVIRETAKRAREGGLEIEIEK